MPPRSSEAGCTVERQRLWGEGVRKAARWEGLKQAGARPVKGSQGFLAAVVCILVSKVTDVQDSRRGHRNEKRETTKGGLIFDSQLCRLWKCVEGDVVNRSDATGGEKTGFRNWWRLAGPSSHWGIRPATQERVGLRN